MPNPFPPDPAGPPIPQFGGFITTQLAYGTPGFTRTGFGHMPSPPGGCGCGCSGGCGGDCGCGCGAGGDSCGDATPLSIDNEVDPGSCRGCWPGTRPTYAANGG